jgi:RNA polymerase sigma factor (sigma-70 family)
MNEEPTTAAIQRYLDALPEDPATDLIIRQILGRAVDRLRVLCGALLYRGYPRLTRAPLNLETDDMLNGVVADLLTAMRKVRPQTVRQFFALAAQHTRWQLNDLARRLDQQPTALPLSVTGAPAAPSTSASMLTPEGRRIWAAIDGLPEEEREIFDLVRVQGLTYAEAAGVVGTSVKTVQRRLTRARLLLAERLAELRPHGADASKLPDSGSNAGAGEEPDDRTAH